MTIDRVGSVDPIQPEKRPGRANQIRETPKTDSISISSEAVEKAELYRVRELVSSANEINSARIEELRAKIADQSYLSKETINATADRIIDALFG